MHHVILTPAAVLGLFISHRAFQPKGVDQLRAAIDTDKIFLREDGGLVKPSEKGVSCISSDTVEIDIENHIHDHLKRAITSAIDDGKTFGFTKEQAGLVLGTEAFDAITKAEKRDTVARPTLVEKSLPEEGKKKGKSASV